MEKIFKLKNFNNFVWTPLGSRVNMYINFCLQVHSKVSAAWYCSHYLPPVANLTPVALIPVAICHQRRWHRYCLHRCQQHKRNWCRWYRWQICPRCRRYRRQFCHQCHWHRWQIWPVVHLDLWISLRIFEKIWNDPTVIFKGLGEGDSWQKSKVENLVTLSF